MKQIQEPHVPVGKLLLGAAVLTMAIATIMLLKDAPHTNAQSTDDTDTTATTDAGTTQSPQDAELFAIIDRINAIKLDGTLFTDPAFTSLQDLSTIIPKQPIGRDNPFLPLTASGTVVQPAVPSKTTAKTTKK